MSEVGKDEHLDQSESIQHERSSQFKHIAGNTGVVAAAGMAGAFANISLRPVHVSFGPDVEAKLSPALNDSGVHVNSGLLNIDLPNAALPFVGEHAGLNAQISKFDVPATSGGEKLDRLVASFTAFDEGIVAPVRDAFIDHAITGASVGAGLAASALAANAGLRYLHKKRQSEHPEKTFTDRCKNIKRATLGVVAVMAAVGVFNLAGPESKPVQAVNTTQDISPLIMKRAPDALAGAKIGGTFGDILHAGAVEVVEKLDRKEKFWEETVTNNSQKALAAFREQGGFDYQNDPDLTAIAHISDTHCDAPAVKYMLGTPMREFNPAIIVNTGDTQTNMQTMPYEANCFNDLIDASRKLDTPMVSVMGNHDIKHRIHAKDGDKLVYDTLSKENDYKISVDGITFVGAPDPRKSTWGATLEMAQEMTDQGKTIADTACKVAEESGEAPMVLSHDVVAAQEAIGRECVAFAFSGHTHMESQITAYRGEGRKLQLAQTIGSLVGAGGGITQIEMPKKDASFGIHIFNKTTREFVEHITYQVRPDGSVRLSPNPVVVQPRSDKSLLAAK